MRPEWVLRYRSKARILSFVGSAMAAREVLVDADVGAARVAFGDKDVDVVEPGHGRSVARARRRKSNRPRASQRFDIR